MGQLSADKIFIMQPLNEEDQKPNPVVERVKMIMIAGLFVVYANRYTFMVSCNDIIKKNFFVFFMQTLRYVAVGYDNVYRTRRSRKRWPRMYCISDPHYFFLCLPLLNSFDVSNFNVGSSVNAFSIGLLFNKISIFK